MKAFIQQLESKRKIILPDGSSKFIIQDLGEKGLFVKNEAMNWLKGVMLRHLTLSGAIILHNQVIKHAIDESHDQQHPKVFWNIHICDLIRLRGKY